MRRAVLFLLCLAVSSAASAQVVLGEPFLADGPRAFPIELDSVASRLDLADSALEREAEALGGAFGEGEVGVVTMHLGRAADKGYDVSRLVRGADGRIRHAGYLVDGRADRASERRRHRVSQYQRFGADGRAVQVSVSITRQSEAECGGGEFSSEWKVTVGADGRALAFGRRDLAYGRIRPPTASPEACVPPAAFAPILAYPTVDALLAGLRVPPLDDLDWMPLGVPGPAPRR